MAKVRSLREDFDLYIADQRITTRTANIKALDTKKKVIQNEKHSSKHLTSISRDTEVIQSFHSSFDSSINKWCFFEVSISRDKQE